MKVSDTIDILLGLPYGSWCSQKPGEMIVWIKEMYVPKPRMSERIEQLYK